MFVYQSWLKYIHYLFSHRRARWKYLLQFQLMSILACLLVSFSVVHTVWTEWHCCKTETVRAVQRHDNHLTVQYSNLRSDSVFVVASMAAKFWKYVVPYTIKEFQNSSGRSCTSLRNVCMKNCQSICNSLCQSSDGSFTGDPYLLQIQHYRFECRK